MRTTAERDCSASARRSRSQPSTSAARRDGEARLLLHIPRASFAVSDARTRPVKGIAIRRFRRGALVGAVLSLIQVVLAVAVMLLVAPPGERPVALLVRADG